MRGGLIALFALSLACSKPASGPATIVTVELEDVQRRLADDKAAGKVAVAHFWATWCGPCIEELPALARLHHRIAKEERIDFFGVAVAEEDPLRVVEFMKESGAKFPNFIAVTDDANRFTDGIDPRWGGVLPTTFVWGPDGKLVIRNIGAVDDTKELEARLRELIGG